MIRFNNLADSMVQEYMKSSGALRSLIPQLVRDAYVKGAQLTLVFTIMFMSTSNLASAQALDIETAERLALDLDPIIKQFQSTSNAYLDHAIADGELPDPEVSFGLLNYPTDTFDARENATTQTQIGISQKFPSFGSLAALSARTSARSAVELARQEERQLSVIRDVKLSWLEVYLWLGTLDILEEYKTLLEEDIQSIEAIYSTGKLSTQRLLEAELTSSLLDDRTLDTLWKLDQARAALAKWIGDEAASRGFPNELPDAGAMPNDLHVLGAFENHPSVQIFKQQELMSRSSIAIAEADFLPRFGVGATYGFREDGPLGQDRADIVSVKVSLSLPFLTGTRQDTRLSARKMELSAARFQTDDRVRELTKLHEVERATYLRTMERLENLDTEILKRAEDNIEAAMTSYQFDASDFDALVRARVSELEARLSRLKLAVERSKSLARLTYLRGYSQ